MKKTGIHEGNGVTEPRKPHNITEERIIAGNKPNKIKTEQKIERKDLCRRATLEMLHHQRIWIPTDHLIGRFFYQTHHRCTRRNKCGNF